VLHRWATDRESTVASTRMLESLQEIQQGRLNCLPTTAFDVNLDTLVWQATENFKGGRSFLYSDDVSMLERPSAHLDSDAAGT
jgi:hypothetical protein